jgi:hypothetical protein
VDSVGSGLSPGQVKSTGVLGVAMPVGVGRELRYASAASPARCVPHPVADRTNTADVSIPSRTLVFLGVVIP